MLRNKFNDRVQSEIDAINEKPSHEMASSCMRNKKMKTKKNSYFIQKLVQSNALPPTTATTIGSTSDPDSSDEPQSIHEVKCLEIAEDDSRLKTPERRAEKNEFFLEA